MIRRGIVISFAAGPPRTAVVAMAGSVHSTITVTVADNILDADVTADRGAFVAFDDSNDLAGAVLIAVWDVP